MIGLGDGTGRGDGASFGGGGGGGAAAKKTKQISGFRLYEHYILRKITAHPSITHQHGLYSAL